MGVINQDAYERIVGEHKTDSGRLKYGLAKDARQKGFGQLEFQFITPENLA